MSAKIMGMVFDLDLPVGEKLVMLAYADHADHQGGSIFPSTALICKKTGYSESQVRRIVKSLEQKKLLVLISGDKGGAGITKHYRIPLDEKGVIVTPFSEKRVSSDTKKGVIATAEKGVIAMTPEPSLTINLTINRDEKKEGEEVTTADEMKKRTEEALFTNIASRSNGGLDLSKYPEDVRPVFQELYRLWGISPPLFSGKANKNGRAADWIAGARELLMVCEEFGLPALERYRLEHFVPYMQSHKGVAPHTVSRPASLINPIAGKIGEWRVESREVSQENPDVPPAIRGMKGRVRYRDKLYFDGKEIIDERPQENLTGL